MTAVVVFTLGLVVLLASAHFVVTSASWFGVRLGLRPTVVGPTLVAAGTSAPELAVVGSAVAVGDAELAWAA